MPRFTSCTLHYSSTGVRSTHFQGGYRGLTQACRVVREEFSPLWFMTRQWLLPVNLLPQYIDFLVHENDRSNHHTAHYVVIAPDGPLSIPNDLDILPLIKLPYNHQQYHICRSLWYRAGPVSGVADIIGRILGCLNVLESVLAGFIAGIHITRDPNIYAAVRNGAQAVAVFTLSDTLRALYDQGHEMPKALDYMGSAEFSVWGVILWQSGKRALWEIDVPSGYDLELPDESELSDDDDY
ncbi:hypothetical protein K491DRAFT_728887 [Lophiostoma macrostomum CBS 122681]|uniref:Uncharacterized protein n=1 Tax=Lophiostoma macrostomum CBS 122681 TaxID=1314788 RepID=A0A6A6SX52_9PLEO|nr:hypothetical protein K491DRAFT_728887 [Lophiostoma macrostomum CBS 122681]